jgi:hypothetical protein
MLQKPLQVTVTSPIGDFHYDGYEVKAVCTRDREGELRASLNAVRSVFRQLLGRFGAGCGAISVESGRPD